MLYSEVIFFETISIFNMLRLERLLGDNDDERPRRVHRERIYFELHDRQYRECFRLSKVQVSFILNNIGDI